jgi:hypothetical protein
MQIKEYFPLTAALIAGVIQAAGQRNKLDASDFAAGYASNDASFWLVNFLGLGN